MTSHLFTPLLQVALIASRIRTRVASVGPQDLSNMLCCLARLGCRPEPGWMASIMTQVRRKDTYQVCEEEV